MKTAVKTILVTGFGPFPGAPVNPTELLMHRLPKRLGSHQHHVAFEFHVLPTTWEARNSVTDKLRKDIKPDAIVHFGVDGTRKTINVESRAVNRAIRVRGDSSGRSPNRPELTPGPERHRFATLPIGPMVTAARTAGVPTNASIDAGTYLCNATLWDSIGSAIPSVFVHVPSLPKGKNDPRPSLPELENAAVSLLHEIARRLR
ncbi:MAG: pyroglutamyl-peptidase I [Roseibium sp.]